VLHMSHVLYLSHFMHGLSSFPGTSEAGAEASNC
jgi:hypothetical protein